jgi:sortase (surface protein transpeptidase)
VSAAGGLGFAGTALVVLGALLLGFIAQFAGLSHIAAARDQQLTLDAFRVQLATATAPVGQVGSDDKLIPLGSPVAIVSIPALGLTQAALEGTSSEVTTHGLGHRRDTPLPGQAGVSVIYGRQSTYGAPFARIGSLQRGDTITVTTGQGESTYRVSDVRYSGDPVPPSISSTAGRLSLVSGGGLPFLPDTVVRVDADLVTPAFVTPNPVFGIEVLDPSELTMAGDPSAWPVLILSLIALGVALALFAISRRFWGLWQSWIVAIPLFLVFGLLAARQVAVLLPNLI